MPVISLCAVFRLTVYVCLTLGVSTGPPNSSDDDDYKSRSSFSQDAPPPRHNESQPMQPADGVAGFECPGSGNCCLAHGAPACATESCCQAVCAVNIGCCVASWTSPCVGLAQQLCGGLCTANPCPGEDSCCEVHSSVGCDDATCCDRICSTNGFEGCCTNGWVINCVDLADTLCGTCAPPSVCPGSGDCCSEKETAGCETTKCCETVCAIDSFCCDEKWDAVCAFKATQQCGELCDCVTFGDLDENGKIDLVDVAEFQNCFSGSGGFVIGDACACADADGDGRVDSQDYAALRVLLDQGITP